VICISHGLSLYLAPQPSSGLLICTNPERDVVASELHKGTYRLPSRINLASLTHATRPSSIDRSVNELFHCGSAFPTKVADPAFPPQPSNFACATYHLHPRISLAHPRASLRTNRHRSIDRPVSEPVSCDSAFAIHRRRFGLAFPTKVSAIEHFLPQHATRPLVYHVVGE